MKDWERARDRGFMRLAGDVGEIGEKMGGGEKGSPGISGTGVLKGGNGVAF